MKMKPRPVDKVILHLDADEVGAYWAAFTFAPQMLPLIHRQPEFVFEGSVPKHTPAYWAEKQTVCFGGGGDFSDEHCSGKRAREQGSSSINRTIQTLEISDAIVKQIGELINFHDSNIGCPRWHFASLLKAARTEIIRKFAGLSPEEQTLLKHEESMKALLWGRGVLGSIYKKMKADLPKIKGESFLKYSAKLLAGLRKEKRYNDADALVALEKTLKKADKDDNILGFKHIWESMWRTTKGSKNERVYVKQYMEMIIHLLYRNEVDYHDLSRQLTSLTPEQAEQIWFDIYVKGKDKGTIKAAILLTDNRMAHTVLRKLGAKVSIVINCRGNVTVQGDQRFAASIPGLMEDMDKGFVAFCAMNRFLDLPPVERKTISWTVLESRGDCHLKTQWYLGDKKADGTSWLMIAKGTDNHDAVEVTDVTASNLVANARHAFCPAYVKVWKKGLRVPKDMADQEVLRAEAIVPIEKALNEAKKLKPRPKRAVKKSKRVASVTKRITKKS